MKLKKVENLQIPRCLQSPNFRRIIDISIHHFSDASELGYGECSYLRYINDDVLIQCSLFLRKSMVSPNKFVSTSRLELTAAVWLVKMGSLLRKTLQIDGLKNIFWTDGQVVLAYIRSNSKWFKAFATSCIRQIKETDQWHYVSSKENPADDASRGLDPRKKTSDSRWFYGSSFLWQVEALWSNKDCSIGSLGDDVELKGEAKSNTILIVNVLANTERPVSNWAKLKRVVGYVLLYKKKLFQSCNKGNPT